MKKLLSIMMVLLMVLGLTACGSGNDDTPSTDTGNNEISNQEQSSNVGEGEAEAQNENGITIPGELIGKYVLLEVIENGEDQTENYKKFWEDKSLFAFVDITEDGKLVMYQGMVVAGELDKREMSSYTIVQVNTESIVLDDGEEFKIENQRLILDTESSHMAFEKTDEIPD